jgi:hypothetical protein
MTTTGELHVVGPEVVGEVELGGGAGLDADLGPVELERTLHAEIGRHHEALAVIEGDPGEDEAQGRVAGQGPGGVARQDVDLARLECREPLLGGQRHELDGVGSPKMAAARARQ